MPYRVENIVRKGEIDCYKQFPLFFNSYISSVHQNASFFGNGLNFGFRLYGVAGVYDFRTAGFWVNLLLFLSNDDSYWDCIRFSCTAGHCFDYGYVERILCTVLVKRTPWKHG